MTLGKSLAPIHAIAEFKQTAQPKNLVAQRLIRKRAHQIVK